MPKKTITIIAAILLISLTAPGGLPSARAQETKWHPTGWGGGGFYWCAAFDPSDANVLYMGGDVIGVYKSVDKGASWKFINRGLQNYAVHSVAVSKSNPKVVYVMTRNGMARSDNGGASWTPLAQTLKDPSNISINRPGSVRAIAVDPANSSIVYAGSGTGGLFKSLDAGETWTALDYAPVNQPANASASVAQASKPAPNAPKSSKSKVKGKDSGNASGKGKSSRPPATSVIASITIADSNPNLIFVAHRQMGLFRSTDGGKTWTRPTTPRNASHVAVSAKNPRIVYGAFDTAGILKSTDGGVTWTDTGKITPENCAVREIAIDPRDPNKIHFIAAKGWNGFYGTSTDGGKTWATTRKWTRDQSSNPAIANNLAQPPEPLSTPTNITISPSEPDTLFISANWANVLSTDGGATWRQRDNGADITCFHDLRFAGGSVFAVAMDEGLFRSDNNGATWQKLLPQKYTEGLSGHQWRVFPQQKPNGQFRIIVTVSPWRGVKEYPNAVLISEDSGKTWTRATGLPDYRPKANTMWEEGYARALAVDPRNPSTMYLGIDGDPENGKSGGGIFKSTDAGLSWAQLPNQPGSRRMFYGLAVDPHDSQRLYWGAGGSKPGIWLSEDGGESWQKTPVSDWIFNIETTASGDVFAGGRNLWKSSDRGKTWRRLTKFTTDWVVVGIAIDPRDENRIWCSTVTWGDNNQGGIFHSADGGKNWQEITGDIPYRKPFLLRYNPQTKDLWAAGVGVFKTKQ